MPSVLKASYYAVNDEKEKVIDSNETVAKRIQMLQEIMQRAATDPTEEDFNPNFVEGLDAVAVSRLLEEDGYDYQDGDNEYEDTSYNDALIEENLENANQEAQRIIEDAKAQAEEIITKAQGDAHKLLDDASNEGFQAGYEDGKNEAVKELEKKEQELEASRQEIEAYKQELEADYENKLNELEPKFIETLTSIYSHVLGISLEKESKVVLHLCQDAIRSIEGTKSYFVHVSEDAFETVSSAKEELKKGLGSNAVIEVIEDITLKGSECFIEADSGIFDISLDIQLDNLKKELLMLSYQKDN